MKRNLLVLVLILLFLNIFYSCNKTSSPSDENLTPCPENSDCSYTFKESSQRVFTYSQYMQQLCESRKEIVISVNKNVSSFSLNKAEIAGGAVNESLVCPCCNTVPLKVIDGKIDGRKINSQKWLINARIIFGIGENKHPVDTVVVNQYFNLSPM